MNKPDWAEQKAQEVMHDDSCGSVAAIAKALRSERGAIKKPTYKWFSVSTGSYRRKFKEQTPERAILYAFRSWAPANPSVLTCVHALGGIRYYFETAEYLRRAGYKVMP